MKSTNVAHYLKKSPYRSVLWMDSIHSMEAFRSSCKSVPEMPILMLMLPSRPKYLLSLLRSGVALGLICLILGLAPFAVAQDVHHELAAADSDGHEHSDTDICQWVQHHIAGSVDLDVPHLALCDILRLEELPSDSILLSAAPLLVGPSRAPPHV